MLEIFVQVLVLMLVVGFSFVAIAGNYLKHRYGGASDLKNEIPDAVVGDDFAPRVLALSAARVRDSSRAA